jgi:hypothetical protein
VISVPYKCVKCIAEGLYYGILAFFVKGETPEPPTCANHKGFPLVPC